jgi:hypothetical protein
MLIGHSVSLCVKDIANGKVPLKDVRKIVGSTRAKNLSDWLRVAEQYARICWSDNPYLCISILFHLLEMNMIEQPRLDNAEYCHNLNYGWWSKEENT